jgi:uracil-DNA glycosylase
MDLFFRKYFSDQEPRYALIGINPGRFGAGITGLPFTDPIRMEEVCGIANAFQKRQELSSVFVYEVIEALGGPEAFYRHFYFTSVCPLGFVKDGKNYNYYDDKELEAAVMPMILDNLKRHREIGVSGKVAFSMGQGVNFKILKRINARHGFFDEILPLPHPRWVMQYRRKRKDEFVHMYVEELRKALVD